MRTTQLLTLSVFALFTGCAAASSRRETCRSETSDSARAVCVSLDTLERGHRLPSRLSHIERTASGFRVVTMPAKPTIVDGMAAIVVGADGRVQSITFGDSL